MEKKAKYLIINTPGKKKTYVVSEKETLRLVFFSTCSFDLDITLTGRLSRADVVGLVVPKPHTDIVVRTVQKHADTNTTSTLLVKSVVPDGTRVTFEGTVRIEKQASGSDAYQRNETMLLGDTAHIRTTPILEILNNDVKCTHGATAKPIPENELLYLESRGISRKQAHEMIVRGFIDNVVLQFPDLKMQKSMYNDIHLI